MAPRRLSGPDFAVGAEVEVTFDEDGFRGAWYPATICRRLRGHRRYFVVYNTLLSDDDPSRPLSEAVLASQLRPRPPDFGDRPPIAVHGLVDGFHRDGWWPGVVGEVREGAFLVRFPATREDIMLRPEKVRPLLRWVNGVWISPEMKGSPERMEFGVGDKVEVVRKPGGSWFLGTVLEMIGHSYFLVEYDCRKRSGGSLVEVVDAQYMRPLPPESDSAKGLQVEDKVEALVDGKWVAGVVSRVAFAEGKYVVKFRHRAEAMEREFELRKLRLPCDWVDGRRNRASVSMDCEGSQAVAGKTGYSLPVSAKSNFGDDRTANKPLSTIITPKLKGRTVTLKSLFNGGTLPHKEEMTKETTPKQKRNDEPSSEGLEQHAQSQKKLKKEESLPAQQIKECCHSKQKQAASSNLASKLPPNSASGHLLYEIGQELPEHQSKEPNVEHSPVTVGSSDNLVTETGNCGSTNVSRGNSKKNRKTVAIRMQDHQSLVPPAKRNMKLERTGRLSKKSIIHANGSKECFEPEYNEIAADLICEDGHATEEFEYPPNSGNESHGTETHSLCDAACRNHCSTPIGDIIGSDVSIERINHRLKVLEGWRISTNEEHTAPQSKSSNRDDIGTKLPSGKPVLDSTPCASKTPFDHQELVPNIPFSVNSIIETAEFLTNPSPGNSPEDAALPFLKNSLLWKPIESMEPFCVLPQKPHFQLLEQYCSEFREGMAIGLMVTFANLFSSLRNLCGSCSLESFQAKLKALAPLEANGFDVQRIRSRIEQLLEIKSNQYQFKTKRTALEEQILELNNNNQCLDATVTVLDNAIVEVEQSLQCFRQRKASMIMQKKANDSEIVKMQLDLHAAEEACISAEYHFHTASNAPW